MAAPDFSPLVSVVDFQTTGVALLGVAAAVVGIKVILKGVNMILSMVGAKEAREVRSYFDD